ncbi:MAG: hypothetical protein NTZ52_07285 [Chlamydiae bacterium]|nr:hypothetical protein [Chlamydiota bacterium]
MKMKKLLGVLGAAALFCQMGFADVAVDLIAEEQTEEMVSSADEELLLKKQAVAVEDTHVAEEGHSH